MSHTTAVAASLPRDALANVLLRLPGSDLIRRCRRVCKEWCDVISDPFFINEHMDHGPWALTHTIVFLRGRSEADGAKEPQRGQGFLFDEDWRLVARFTAGESEDMVGTCNGLLCFLDVHQGAINVVEPFTGESLALPLPPKSEMLDEDEEGAYCFGFDPSTRRYKIFHLGLDLHTDGTTEQGLYVYTIGGGDNWRKVQIAGITDAVVPYKNPVLADGSLYLSVNTDQLARLARFDLAMEKITLVSITDFLRVDDRGRKAFHPMTDSDARMCVMTVGWSGNWDVFFMEESGCWTQNSCSGVILPPGRRCVRPQALQRRHLLLKDYRDGGLYAHPIEPAGHDLGSGKLLLKVGKEKDKASAKSNTRGLFIPARLNQVPEMVDPHKWRSVATFCYAPPLSPAPLAQRCGIPCDHPPQHLADKKVTSTPR